MAITLISAFSSILRETMIPHKYEILEALRYCGRKTKSQTIKEACRAAKRVVKQLKYK
jgi:hypothetical protein